MRIDVTDRPYVFTLQGTGQTYLATAEQAQRALDGYRVLSYGSDRVTVQAGYLDRPEDRVTLQPATRGGGPAFVITREN
jgi:hypothetical protein